jgi:ribonuclease P protein component
VVQIHSTGASPPDEAPEAALSRVGFVVGRSVGSAVVRNRVSRRLRAHLGQRLCDLPGGLDIVVRALPSAADAPFAELVTDTDRCLDKALAKVGQGAGTVGRRVP